MKFASFEIGGKESFGVVTGAPGDEGVIDLGPRKMTPHPRLINVLRAGKLAEAMDLAAGAEPDHGLAEVSLLKPITVPEKIICIGVNYGNRAAEYDNVPDKPNYPSVFMRWPGSMTAHGQPLMRPPESEQLDYEGEIAIIIGKAGRRIKPENIREHIAGLSCLNEGTIRDWLRHGTFNVTQGKNFANSGAYGPWMVTEDEFADFNNITLETRVNGEVRQKDSTANILFDFAYILSYLSVFYQLNPGDVIASGTPTGAGARFDPPIWLQPGDVVEVEVENIGTLSNGIEDEVV
ncbi:MAG: fumarylacetoacetate hydrolase family protein [Rhodospirillales bacterium]|jgi:5-carboxymethyl-2-hydroxymuconate isomerase|nr:2-hydroxyhepta-2,4-diene-1,7-dioate isomerase [Rhodospirillaceae bacterium]MDP6427220.1 fumarylacetoacetate hydrolase family protein [Rhodospirillales bacterium]MDP6645416.1 fumarylacetoacetate hydrolase family protein [Rhodospirillales bacterium]MDP6841316.1 fumarylacetoacetate hydrolase family protein [Rhodospirillales bacterium]|tara:strand:+ start:2706 stop:3581 length:876 start_codon:yes stop_codon:yes gene_type:complete